MLTTLRTGSLALSSVQYKFDANKRLTIKLTTSSEHKLYGDVKITLANVKNINIYDSSGNLVEDFFNDTFIFSRAGSTTLEYSQVINSVASQAESFTVLDDDGNDIEATIDNASFDLPVGTYNFLLLDSENSNFSTSKISAKLLNIGGTIENGVESLFDELGNGNYLSINNQELHFQYPARISLYENDAGVTNIPLVVNEV